MHIKEKREYYIELKAGNPVSRILKMITKYSYTGNIISEIEPCNDSDCCEFNKSFHEYKNKNDFTYENGRLLIREFYTCDLSPSYKDFYEYKFDNKKRLIKRKEKTYSYKLPNEGRKKDDSTLTETNIHFYKYNNLGNLIEENITISKFQPNTKITTWKKNTFTMKTIICKPFMNQEQSNLLRQDNMTIITGS